jgi:hypothetical protein
MMLINKIDTQNICNWASNKISIQFCIEKMEKRCKYIRDTGYQWINRITVAGVTEYILFNILVSFSCKVWSTQMVRAHGSKNRAQIEKILRKYSSNRRIYLMRSRLQIETNDRSMWKAHQMGTVWWWHQLNMKISASDWNKYMKRSRKEEYLIEQ